MGELQPPENSSAPSPVEPVSASEVPPPAGLSADELAALLPPPESIKTSPSLEFTGDHREFFRVWIANTFLTLITLGVYAAWAKVRQKRYLYGHTRLLGHSFDFTAVPRGLLAGNVVVALLFLGYAIFGEAYPMIRAATVGLAIFLVPWLLTRALAFNARHTVHRGLRLRHRGKYGMAFAVYVLLPIACVVTLGLLYPRFAHARRKFAIDYLRYGEATFEFHGKAKAFYGIYFRAILWMLPAFVLMIVLALVFAEGRKVKLGDGTPLAYVLSVIWLIGFVFAKLQVQAQRFTYVWNHTTLNEHRFRADMSFKRLLKLQLVNLLAIVGTLGLAYPWAKLRSVRFTLDCLEFIPGGSLDRIQRFGTSKGGALGDAAADFFGIDIGL